MATVQMMSVFSNGMSSSTEQQEFAPQPFPDDCVHSMGFVAQIVLRPISPLPQTDLAYSDGTWYAKRCEAV